MEERKRRKKELIFVVYLLCARCCIHIISNLRSDLGDRYDYPHFIELETEAQRVEVTCSEPQ